MSQHTPSESEQAIGATKAWVDAVVVGLNFCPFAKREVVAKSIRYEYVDRYDKNHIEQLLEQECSLLNSHKNIETTLLIFGTGLEGFYDYLDALDIADEWIDNSGHRGTYQIASFHPDYIFEGELSNSPANYTNRSPFPMFHLLRESSLEKAIHAHKNPEQIPIDNIRMATSLGKDKLKALLRACLAQ